MGDVENVCDAEYEGEPKGGQSIRAALEHSREDQLNKNLQLPPSTVLGL